MQDKISIIIPAAGLGRRMKSYGPKPLININNRALLNIQLEVIRNVYPQAEIILVIGFSAEKIYKVVPKNVKVIENKNYDITNVGRSIALGLQERSHDNSLIIYGDLLFNEKALAIPMEESSIVIDNQNRLKESEVGVTVVEDYACQFSYGLPTKWGQIAYLRDKELYMFQREAIKDAYDKYYGFELLNLVINKGGLIRTIEPLGMKLAEIDTSKDIDIAKKILEG